jgi:hypothetical protein
VDQCIWGCREIVTGSDVNNMQALEDGEEHGAGLRTATQVHEITCIMRVRKTTQQKDCDTSWKLTMIKVKNAQIKIKYHSRALQF